MRFLSPGSRTPKPHWHVCCAAASRQKESYPSDSSKPRSSFAQRKADARHDLAAERSRPAETSGGPSGGAPEQRRGRPQPSQPVVRTAGKKSGGTFFHSKTFEEVGASPEIISALNTLGIKRPSHVQVAAYQALLSSAPHIVLGDHAGSGKTLAYLLPLVQRMREEERAGGVNKRGKAPRVVVLAPTAELCTQVLRVARALARGAPFKSVVLTGGHKWRTQKEALEEGPDLVVATPGRLIEHLKEGNLALDLCKAIVMDEVDILLGDTTSFAEQIQPLRQAAGTDVRFVLVTATLPEYIYAQLQQDFPGIQAAIGPGLHRTAPGIVEQLVDCSGGDVIDEETGFERKAHSLMRLLRQNTVARTIVFCNKIETCRKVENLLTRSLGADMQVLPYHSAIVENVRTRNLQTFLAKPQGSTRAVLICTDRASRGVDSAYVEHVVLFDFCRDPSEYVRRVGRTGRGAGGVGLVSILVLGRQVQLARQIIERNQSGLPIHSVPLATI
ncbi:hypothetical protein WJX72_011720 [[Myrmecia] bisecta]|uniref:RNA helicase n=1 Tax=[Myrmecia] bisecta TaxID=41462 RepID=A0AAW1PU29_9CHLO